MPKKTTGPQRRYREDLSETPDWLKKKKCPNRDSLYVRPAHPAQEYRAARRNWRTSSIHFPGVQFGARLREGCQLFAEKMLEPDVTIGMSFSGALTPAGLGCSSIVPLIKAGFVDWIVSTGANPVPRPALRAELSGEGGQLQDGRYGAAEQRHRAGLRRAAGLQRLPHGHRRDPARHPGAARIPEGDGHGRAALPAGQVRGRVGAQGAG